MRLSESTTKFEIELVDKQMQKIKQTINDCQMRFGKVMGCGTCKSLLLCTWVKELCDTIECMKKHIEALRQENEQYKVRLAEADKLREVLKYIVDQIEGDFYPEEMSTLHRVIIKTAKAALRSEEE